MNLQLFYYECKICHKYFKAPHLLGDVYGEFLMRNKKSEIVYLNSFTDPVFDEVEKIFKNSKVIPPNISQDQQIKLFQTIFSIACDSASDGSIFCINYPPQCPACDSSEFSHWGPVSPAEYMQQEIKPATHDAWNQLSIMEKQINIDNLIQNYYANYAKQ